MSLLIEFLYSPGQVFWKKRRIQRCVPLDVALISFFLILLSWIFLLSFLLMIRLLYSFFVNWLFIWCSNEFSCRLLPEMSGVGGDLTSMPVKKSTSM